MRIHSPGYNKKKASARWGSRIGCLTSVRVPGWLLLLLLVVHTTPGGAAGWGWGHASPTTYPHIPSTTTATGIYRTITMLLSILNTYSNNLLA